MKFSTKRISRIPLFCKIKNTAAHSALYTERPSYFTKNLEDENVTSVRVCLCTCTPAYLHVRACICACMLMYAHAFGACMLMCARVLVCAGCCVHYTWYWSSPHRVPDWEPRAALQHNGL